MSVDKYRVILADPPWSYRNRHETRSDGKRSRFGIGVKDRYSLGVMSVEDICSLPVEDVAADNAYLFMWATWPNLLEAMKVIEAWGFRYVSVAFVWAKTNKNGGWFYGPGRYIPSNSEPCLFAVRGRPFTPNTGEKPCQIVAEPHPRDHVTGKIIHSRKPFTVHERIEQWCGPGLELFATLETPGWTCLGHELTCTDIREDLEKIINHG